MQEEIRVVCAVLASHDLSLAGVHLEMTPDDVTECVDNANDLSPLKLDRRPA
jgi:3-deoxy-D-arabino-heptulosonate 7-phosphate (DAHP) synthase class II